MPKRDTYSDDKAKAHKDIKLDMTRAKYWIGVGAQPTETVWRLLSYVGILHPKRLKVEEGKKGIKVEGVKVEPTKVQA
ncbi:hypothetical protein OQA88_10241 [Cercophora sp. LCS_1]